ncbi:hypothetical protein WHT83_06340 [Aminobacter sp. P9b]|uniref:hypothetical protein n=1 Tax=Aminobacter sp. P9b TaxID=3133697 RepID=UPI00325484CC
MTADQIIQCSYEASAMLCLCEAAAWAIQNGENSPEELAGAIVAGMQLARDLVGVMHDALESHEGLKGGAQ